MRQAWKLPHKQKKKKPSKGSWLTWHGWHKKRRHPVTSNFRYPTNSLTSHPLLEMASLRQIFIFMSTVQHANWIFHDQHAIANWIFHDQHANWIFHNQHANWMLNVCAMSHWASVSIDGLWNCWYPLHSNLRIALHPSGIIFNILSYF